MYGSGLGDELTALTGVSRARPTTNVNRIPEPPKPGSTIHRDHSVERDTVLRIIDGIKQL